MDLVLRATSQLSYVCVACVFCVGRLIRLRTSTIMSRFTAPFGFSPKLPVRRCFLLFWPSLHLFAITLCLFALKRAPVFFLFGIGP